MSLTLYTINCPKCIVLEKKLQQAGIKFETCDDVKVMEELGIDTLPVLRYNDKLMNFNEAVSFIKNYVKD